MSAVSEISGSFSWIKEDILMAGYDLTPACSAIPSDDAQQTGVKCCALFCKQSAEKTIFIRTFAI